MKIIRLYGVVGWEILPALFIAELEELEGEDVELHIASPGGYVDDALAIYSALRGYEGQVRAVVSGLAASAASWIAMAADEVWMGPDSLLMIHGPWTWTSGDAAQLRSDADVLDKYARIMRRAYARHGYEGDDLLVDGDHWFAADEALEAGLITGVLEDDEDETQARAQVLATLLHNRRREVPDYDVPPEMAARLRGWAARSTDDEDTMGTKKRNGRLAPLAVTTEEVEELIEDLEEVVEETDEGEEVLEDDLPEEVLEDGTIVDEDDEDEDAEEMAPEARVQRERRRVEVITALADRGYFNATQRNRLIRRGVSANRARAVAIEMGARNQTRVRAVRGGDGAEKRREGMVQALVDRGLGRAPEGPNEWRGRSLRAMAAVCHPDLARNYDGAELIDAVLARAQGSRVMASADGGITHGTSDFVHILGDTVHRTLLIGYNEIPDTWSPWTNRADLQDFRPTPRVGLGAFPDLQELAEMQEIPSHTIPDRGVVARLGEYAGKFGISRRGLIGDDLSQFTEIPRRQGQAARRTVANKIYGMINDNPTIESAALFSATHNTTHAQALAAAGIGVLRGAMRKQTQPTGDPDVDSEQIIDIMPRILLVPTELYGYALELVQAVLADGGGTNVWAGSMQVIEEPRLSSGANWYLIASGAEADTIEVAYLQGREEPLLDDMEGWTRLGVEFRVIHDFGVTLRDFRGFQRGTGGAPE